MSGWVVGWLRHVVLLPGIVHHDIKKQWLFSNRVYIVNQSLQLLLVTSQHSEYSFATNSDIADHLVISNARAMSAQEWWFAEKLASKPWLRL